MVPGYVFFIIFTISLYIYTRNNSRLSATASAIREIFSGTCRQTCQDSLTERTSTFSELQQASTSVIKDAPGTCLCGTCPCALLDNVLKRCSPATQMYTDVIDRLSDVYYNALQTLLNMFDEVSRVLECRGSCQRPVEVNISHIMSKSPHTPKEKILRTLKTSMSKVSLLKPKASKVLTRSSVMAIKSAIFGKEEKIKSENNSLNDTSSTDTVVPSAEATVISCSRCVKNANVCISRCPRSGARKK